MMRYLARLHRILSLCIPSRHWVLCALIAEPAFGLTRVFAEEGNHPPTATNGTLRAVSSADVRWSGGFWKQKLDVVAQGVLPSLLACYHAGTIPNLRNFRLAAGLDQGTWSGAFSSDGDLFQWIEAAARIFSVTKDPALGKAMEDVIAIVARTQRADGYISTAVQAGEGSAVTSCGSSTAGAFRGAKQFTAPEYSELDNLGRLFSAAVAHYEATGKTSLLDVATRAADRVIADLGRPESNVSNLARVPSIVGGAVDLFRLTNDRRYLDLARTFVDRRGQVTKVDFGAMQRAYTADFVDLPPSVAGTDQYQERTPLRDEREAVGNSVSAHQLYAGAAAVQFATGDRSLAVALNRIWESAAERKLAVTGGAGAMYAAISSPGYKAWGDPVREAYGADYDLPVAHGFYGTCGNVGFAEWNWRMFEGTGDARYLDALERVVCNAVLAGMSYDGAAFATANPLRRDLPPVPVSVIGGRKALPANSCCAVSISRLVARMASWAYAVSPGGLRVNLFGASTLNTQLSDGTRLSVTQCTDYPWNGEVTLTLDLPRQSPFALRLRLPGWCRRADVRAMVNQEPAAITVDEAGWLKLERTWVAGDVVWLDLPMPVEMLAGHPKIEEARGHVAVQRGPLVYCLEGADVPAGGRVGDVRISRDTKLRPVVAPDLLDGATALEGRVILEQSQPWRGELYRVRSEPERREVSVRFIPYFTWDNRGVDDMAVWLPLSD